MEENHAPETLIDTLILLLVGLLGWSISHAHDILGIGYLSLSIAFVLWKWRRDYKKGKEEK